MHCFEKKKCDVWNQKFNFLSPEKALEGQIMKILELLLTNAADVNIQDGQGFTALHISAVQNYRDCVQLLVTNGANVNAVNNAGQIPLALAEASGSVNCAELIRNTGGITKN